ncbi:MAG: hypothetical protein QG608_1346, partial [Actinomycetota bacterium]|nr:hypothetical protein [Actinomycetota bacterium]
MKRTTPGTGARSPRTLLTLSGLLAAGAVAATGVVTTLASAHTHTHHGRGPTLTDPCATTTPTRPRSAGDLADGNTPHRSLPGNRPEPTGTPGADDPIPTVTGNRPGRSHEHRRPSRPGRPGPSCSPTAGPTATPTGDPTDTPTIAPTEDPGTRPTARPT